MPDAVSTCASAGWRRSKVTGPRNSSTTPPARPRRTRISFVTPSAGEGEAEEEHRTQDESDTPDPRQQTAGADLRERWPVIHAVGRLRPLGWQVRSGRPDRNVRTEAGPHASPAASAATGSGATGPAFPVGSPTCATPGDASPTGWTGGHVAVGMGTAGVDGTAVRGPVPNGGPADRTGWRTGADSNHASRCSIRSSRASVARWAAPRSSVAVWFDGVGTGSSCGSVCGSTASLLVRHPVAQVTPVAARYYPAASAPVWAPSSADGHMAVSGTRFDPAPVFHL